MAALYTVHVLKALTNSTKNRKSQVYRRRVCLSELSSKLDLTPGSTIVTEPVPQMAIPSPPNLPHDAPISDIHDKGPLSLKKIIEDAVSNVTMILKLPTQYLLYRLDHFKNKYTPSSPS